MKAGKSNLSCDTKIVIKNIAGEDADLNGLTGTITHPFGCFLEGDVGVYIDEKFNVPLGKVNIFLGEFEAVDLDK